MTKKQFFALPQPGETITAGPFPLPDLTLIQRAEREVIAAAEAFANGCAYHPETMEDAQILGRIEDAVVQLWKLRRA